MGRAYARRIGTLYRRLRSAPRTGSAIGPGAIDRGASLIALLVVLVVLGVTAAIVVTALPSSTSLALPTSSTTLTTHAPGGGTTTTTTQTIISGALLAACVANVQAVKSAVSTYETLNGSKPPRGTSWATSTTHGGPYLQSWPTATARVTVTWNGVSVVVTPAHGRAAVGSAGTTSPPTGCDTI